MILTNFLKENQSKLKLTKKLIVRDLDETEKNVFVAYVDEGKNSFDVQLILDSKNSIKKTQCDCENNNPCIHIIALVNFISGNNTQKITLKKEVKRKLTVTDQILETITNDDLRVWISEILNKNKEVAFLFKNNFSKTTPILDKESVQKIILDCLFSVIGKRRTIESNEVKKIVDALNISLKPVLTESLTTQINKEKYELIKIIIVELEAINYDYYISSIKITRYIETIYGDLIKSLFNIKDFEIWKNCIEFYFELLFDEKTNDNDIQLCKQIYDNATINDLYKSTIAKFLEQRIDDIYKKTQQNFFNISFSLEKFLLKIIVENNLFDKHFDIFRPRRFQNEYNLFLIQKLVEIDKMELVEKFCNEQIIGNSNQHYDIPYVNILLDVYRKNNDEDKLAKLLSIYGKYSFNIENYIFIKNKLQIEDFKKYRQAVLTNSKNSYQNGNEKAFDFYFEVKKIDGNVSGLLDMLENCRNLNFVNKYKEIAVKLDEVKFVKIVCNYFISFNYDPNIILKISDFVCDTIDKSKLQFYLKSFRGYSQNKIYKAIEENLNKK